MKRIGAIILSFEETEDLSELKPWKEAANAELYATLRESIPINGLVALSTCNRVELIYSINPGEPSEFVTHENIATLIVSKLPSLASHVKPVVLNGREAVRHLLRLGAGLESMIVGETEIRAQMKQAFEEAGEIGALDPVLRLLFHRIFQEARAIRAAIPMGRLPLSAATLSIRKLRDRFHRGGRLPDLGDAAMVVIGSGPMSRQSAEYLSKWAPRVVWVNRTISKIETRAAELGAQVMAFDEFMADPSSAGPVAAVVTATSRSDAFITPEFIASLRRADDGAALTLVDLALPADVDEACGRMNDIEIISLETLRAELDQNRRKREEAAEAAAAPTQAALLRVEAEFISAVSAPIIKNIQKDVRDKSRRRLEQLLDDRLAHLTEKDKRLLYNWAIQANKDLNRIHRRGMESVLRNYFSDDVDVHRVETEARSSHS